MKRSLSAIACCSILFVACLHVAPARADDLYEYDAVGRLTKITYSAGGTSTYAYDANGNLLSVVHSGTPVAVEPPPRHFTYAVGRSFPDPASDASNLSFSIPARERVSLEVMDVRGRQIAALMQGVQEPGEYHIRFDTRGRAPGLYFYRLRVGDRLESRRFVVLR